VVQAKKIIANADFERARRTLALILREKTGLADPFRKRSTLTSKYDILQSRDTAMLERNEIILSHLFPKI
jgi:hypothetical protein